MLILLTLFDPYIIVGDAIEGNAIKHIFGNHSNKLYVSSTKGSVGHMLGAAGSVEAIFTVLALYNQIIPATLNLQQPDIDGLNYVANHSIDISNQQHIQYAMTNSFGFGGTNASLIFKKYNQ